MNASKARNAAVPDVGRVEPNAAETIGLTHVRRVEDTAVRLAVVTVGTEVDAHRAVGRVLAPRVPYRTRCR